MDALQEMQQDLVENTQKMTSGNDEDICLKCKNTGWVIYEDANGCFWQKQCECGIRQRQILKNRLKFASVPMMYANTRLKDLRYDVYLEAKSREVYKKAAGAIKYWLDNLDKMLENGKGMYFLSVTKGSGKTMTASAIANELLYEKHIPVKFATFSQILDAIKATYDDRSKESEAKLISDLQTVKVLFVDEFGISKATPWVNEKFYAIINGRYSNKLPTIFTSNMSLYESEEVGYDERITDRIREMCYMILFPGESVRKNIQEENRKEIGL